MGGGFEADGVADPELLGPVVETGVVTLRGEFFDEGVGGVDGARHEDGGVNFDGRRGGVSSPGKGCVGDVGEVEGGVGNRRGGPGDPGAELLRGDVAVGGGGVAEEGGVEGVDGVARGGGGHVWDVEDDTECPVRARLEPYLLAATVDVDADGGEVVVAFAVRGCAEEDVFRDERGGGALLRSGL